MRKELVWNSFIGASGTAVFAAFGWLVLNVVDLKSNIAARDAEQDLRTDITDALRDVDKRLAVIEVVMKINGEPERRALFPVYGATPDIEEAEEAEEESPAPTDSNDNSNSIQNYRQSSRSNQPQNFGPKYDLRNNK